MRESERDSYLGVLIAFGIIVTSLYFRVWMLGNIPGMNGDEAWWGSKVISFLQAEPIDWKTNSGNFTDPFYLLPLAGLHALFGGSFVLVRVIAVVSGILLLPVNYLLCRKIINLRTAIISTLLLAVLPINIMYSRFGWEPSQSVLFSLPVMYSALWYVGAQSKLRWAALATCLCLGAALLVHPANFFLVCFPLTAFLIQASNRLREPWKIPGYAAAVGVGMGLLGVLAYGFAPEFTKTEMAARLPAFPWPGDWIYFLGNYLRLFSGINSYRYIAGSCEWTTTLPNGSKVDFHVWDILTALLFISAFWLLIFQARHRESDDIEDKSIRRKDYVLVAFILSSSLLFFVLSGPVRMGVSYERYVLWMVAPGVLLLSRGFDRVMQRWPRSHNWCTISGLIFCALLLLGFYLQYFQFMQQTGGRSEMAFRTAAVEPKLAAAEYIIGRSNSEQTTYVVSSDWFCHWPMAYIAKTKRVPPNVRFVLGRAVEDPAIAVELDKALQTGHLYFAELGEQSSLQQIRRGLVNSGIKLSEKTFFDYGGKPAVNLIQPLARNQTQNVKP